MFSQIFFHKILSWIFISVARSEVSRGGQVPHWRPGELPQVGSMAAPCLAAPFMSPNRTLPPRTRRNYGATCPSSVPPRSGTFGGPTGCPCIMDRASQQALCLLGRPGRHKEQTPQSRVPRWPKSKFTAAASRGQNFSCHFTRNNIFEKCTTFWFSTILFTIAKLKNSTCHLRSLSNWTSRRRIMSNCWLTVSY